MGTSVDWPAWGLALKNLLFPIFCRDCGERLHTDENILYCATCWELSPRIRRPYCPSCGLPHAQDVGLGMQSTYSCAECRSHPNPHLARVYAPARYEGPVQEAIKQFKFHGRLGLQAALGALLLDYADAEMEPERYGLVVPVPLHPVRERARGYNQSMLLAEAIASAFPNAQLATRLLRRVRPTHAQPGLDAKAREKNVRGAFEIDASLPEAETITGARVLLIDDVITTRSTATECARTLRIAGAKQVDALAVALAVNPSLTARAKN